jgi:hypothetical protein
MPASARVSAFYGRKLATAGTFMECNLSVWGSNGILLWEKNVKVGLCYWLEAYGCPEEM